MAEVADKDIKKHKTVKYFDIVHAWHTEADCCLVVDELGLDLKVVSVMARGGACFSESWCLSRRARGQKTLVQFLCSSVHPVLFAQL